MSDAWDPWSYRSSTGRKSDSGGMVGYKVHATDGDIGKIDRANDEVGNASIVVDTGPWIFGRQVVLPAGTIQRVDDEAGEVYLALTRQQIKDSPELKDGGDMDDASYRQSVGEY